DGHQPGERFLEVSNESKFTLWDVIDKVRMSAGLSAFIRNAEKNLKYLRHLYYTPGPRPDIEVIRWLLSY
ncbi:MAG: hypothetical protein ACYSYT_00745, partial [Planctomycetota bacterium]